jgi:tetratricopeptide (TPR) repeat protein
MSQIKPSVKVIFLFVLIFSLLTVNICAQQQSLGKVDFPTSGSKKAQELFLQGVAALHSFEYEDALEYFREATKLDPDFAMGYWGEAMTHNHPLWSEQDFSSARAVLAKIKDTSKLTERERAYINAVRVLYGEGDKLARDKAYSAAMGQIYRAYPNDNEAACFYALSLMGAIRPGDKDMVQRKMQAGAIALDVYQKNPNHPGAAHYVIHAFDDPDHAILALPAAFRYAQIAPAAEHALHMPSHIFFSLGMWPEAVASNEAAWTASNEWVRRKNHHISMRDYHSLHWLLYAYLQQGRYQKAEELLRIMQQTMKDSTNESSLSPYRYVNYYADMAAAFVMETERWDLAESIFKPLNLNADQKSATSGPQTSSGGGMQMSSSSQNTVRSQRRYDALPVFMNGFVAAMRGVIDAEKDAIALREMGKPSSTASAQGNAQRQKYFEVFALEIEALRKAANGDYTSAIELMKRATENEEGTTMIAGPVTFIKPSHELFGEILLRAGKPREAAEMFALSLQRQPNRARSLLGAARAAAKSGDSQTAAKFYSQLLQQWKNADTQLAELREAQDYMKQAKVD